MALGDNQYYSNTSHPGQMQNNAQGYQSGYWYQQSNNTPTTASQLQAPSTTYQAARDNYGYSNANISNASYRDRTNYDTGTINALPSINSALNGEFSRTSEAPAQIYAYAQATQTERQHDNPAYQQATHSATTQNAYAQHQARPSSSNLNNLAAQSAYVAPTPRTTQVTQATQPQPYQPPQQTQRQSTSSSSRSQMSSQWAPLNQQQRQSVSDTTTGAARPSEYIARAATSASTATAQPNRQTTTHTPTTSTQTQPPVPATVDPHAVYDPYQEYQRRRQRREEEEAERKRVAEAEEAVKEAEEAAREAERLRLQAAEEAARENDRTATATPEVTVVEPPKKKARQRKSEGAATGAPKPRKPRKSAPAASTAPAAEVDVPAQEAAMTLLATANSTSASSLEEQMKEMFKKMREFNSKDPDMLARMWQSERDEYLLTEGDSKKAAEPTTTAAVPVAMRPSKRTPAKSTPQAKSKAAGSAAPATTPALDGPAAAASGSTLTRPTAQEPSVSTTIATPTTAKPTMWPAEKKQTLANEAAKLLTLDPANAGKVITGAQIGTILDTNPTYIELCQTLDSLGFRIDRGTFARALLKAVPDVNRSAQRPLTATGQAPPAVAGAAQSSLNAGAQLSVNTTAGLTNAANRLLDGGAIIETSHVPKPSPNTKTPRSRKDDSARKSKSSISQPIVEDIDGNVAGIDPQLEGLDAVKRFIHGQWQDVIESPVAPAIPASGSPSTVKTKGRAARPPRPTIPPAPTTKEEIARKKNFADLVDLTALDSDDEPMPDYYPDAKLQDNEYPAAPIQLMTPPQTETEQAPATAASLVAPIAPMASTTSNIPLPAIQRGPQLTFQPRPVQAPAPAPPRVALDHPTRTTLMVQPIDKYKAIRRSQYNPKTIARDILLACGRHPDMRHLNAHLEVLKTAFPSIDNSGDIETFRWDIADPGGPAPGFGAEAPTGFEASEMSDDADDEEESDRESAPVRVAIGANGAPEVEVGPRTAALRETLHKITPTRIPRPSDGTRSNANDADGRTTKSSGSGSHHLAQTGGGYAALRATQNAPRDEDGNPIKRRGRPVGWRKWMQKDGGGTPGSSTPAPKSKAPARPPSPEPVYQVYKCDWKDCGAELHNLATLRKHIFKLHGKPASNGLYPCNWNDCGKVRSIVEGGRTISRFVSEELLDKSSWEGHMETKHIKPVAWELGDGPAGGLSERESDANSEAYLSDARGRRVTPAIVVPKPAAAAGGSGDASGGRAESRVEKEARELQRLAEKRKRDMGVGIDKGGATLANEKRRRGFLDDEDEEMVVDPED